MTSLLDGYVGRTDEVSYGTGLAPVGFDEVLSEAVSGKYERIESAGLRAGNSVLRTDRFIPNPKGAAGDVKLEVLDNNFDFWIKHMLGSAVTAAPVGGFATTTGTIATLAGKSFTLEAGRVGTNPSVGPTVFPFRYAGGKVVSWEIANSVDGTLQATLTCDFASEKTAGLTAATPVYPANSQLLTFVTGAVTIGGTSVAVTDVSVKGDNGLKVDRYALRGANSTTKREPLTEGLRAFTFDIKMEFEDLTQVNRVASATAAGALAVGSLVWDSPQVGELKIDLPFMRFDDGIPNMDGQKVLDLDMTGTCLSDGTVSALTFTYKAKQ